MTGNGFEPDARSLVPARRTHMVNSHHGRWPPNFRWQWASDHRARSSRRASDTPEHVGEAIAPAIASDTSLAQASASPLPLALAEQVQLVHNQSCHGHEPHTNIVAAFQYEYQTRHLTESGVWPQNHAMSCAIERAGASSLLCRSSNHPPSDMNDNSFRFTLTQQDNHDPHQFCVTNSPDASYWPSNSHPLQAFSPDNTQNHFSNSTAWASTLPLQQQNTDATPVISSASGLVDFDFNSSHSGINTSSMFSFPEFGVFPFPSAHPSLYDVESHNFRLRYYTQENQVGVGNEGIVHVDQDMGSTDLTSVYGLVNWDGTPNCNSPHELRKAVPQDSPSHTTARPNQESLYPAASPAAISYAGMTGITNAQRLPSASISPVLSVPDLVTDADPLPSPHLEPVPATPLDGDQVPDPTIVSSPQAESSPFTEVDGEVGVHKREFICETCGHVAPKNHALNKHKKTHIKPHKCVFADCPRFELGFAIKRDRDRHLNSVHYNHDEYFCPLNTCPRHETPFSRKDNLKRHVRELHPGITVAV